MRLVLVLPATLVVVTGLVWWLAGGTRAADQVPEPDAVALSGPETAQATGEVQESSSGGGDVPFSSRLPDPVVIAPCVLNPAEQQEVSSQLDGVLQTVGVTLGRKVHKGDVLAQLDADKLLIQIELLQIRADSNAAELIAKAQYDEAAERVEYAIKANSTGIKAVGDLEFKSYVAQRDRFALEMKKAREEQETAKKELAKVKLLLDLHQIRSAVTGEVVKVCKKPGEAVRQAEPLFQIAGTDQLQVEGFCKVQHAGHLKTGSPVLVEPELQGAQVLELIGHTATITGLAIAPDGKLLASASEDGTVLLWSWPSGVRVGELPHAGPVYAVAIAAKAQSSGSYRVLTGGANHKLRLWTVTTAGQVEGPMVLTGHDGAIRSVVFDPDGTRFWSGSEDRRIGCWDVATGKLCYWVHAPGAWKQAAHQGAVTSLRITPSGLLASAGRDNVLKVWKVGTQEARLVKTHSGRTGDVLQLDAHASAMCFDHGDELRLLDVRTGAVTGVLRNQQHGAFKEFALFSPSGRLLVSSAVNGRIQLWRAPAAPAQQHLLWQAQHAGLKPADLLALTPGAGPLSLNPLLPLWGPGDKGGLVPQLWDLGGFELRYYRSPNATTARCAVFAPKETVFFTGGADRVIHVWSIPPEDNWQPREAVLTFVGGEVEQGTDLVRVQAVLENPDAGPRHLLPGTSVTIKAYPE